MTEPVVEQPETPKRKEIYTYTAPWTTYAMAWSRRPDGRFKMAVGSYIEEYANKFHIIQLQQNDQENWQFQKRSDFDHPYPATKVMWIPPKHNLTAHDLIATTGDYLRLWNIDADNKVELKGVLNNNKHAGSKTNSIVRIHAVYVIMLCKLT